MITTSAGFKALEKDSRGRNRGPNEALMESLDPEGVHVVARQFLHNDCELRVMWLVKQLGVEEPATVWMDNSFEALQKYTVLYPDVLGESPAVP